MKRRQKELEAQVTEYIALSDLIGSVKGKENITALLIDRLIEKIKVFSDRPAFSMLEADIQAGRVGAVIVRNMDRIGCLREWGVNLGRLCFSIKFLSNQYVRGSDVLLEYQLLSL